MLFNITRYGREKLSPALPDGIANVEETVSMTGSDNTIGIYAEYVDRIFAQLSDDQRCGVVLTLSEGQGAVILVHLRDLRSALRLAGKCKLTEYTTLEQMITTGHSDIIDGTPCQALEK